MAWTETSSTVFGNKRVVMGIASGDAAQHTTLNNIDSVQLTGFHTVGGTAVSGVATTTISESGSFTIVGQTDAQYQAILFGH